MSLYFSFVFIHKRKKIKYERANENKKIKNNNRFGFFKARTIIYENDSYQDVKEMSYPEAFR
jgi:hypothetical protein